MNFRIAKFLSFILHPALMPTYAMVLLFQMDHFFVFNIPLAIKLAVILVVFFNTFVMPLLISFLLLRNGIIKSFYMEERQERNIPLISFAALLMIAYYMLLKIPLPDFFFLMLLGATASVIIVTLINFKWKISIHMAGIGAMAGIFFGLSSLLLVDLRVAFVISILTAGMLGVARLKMSAHEPLQIYAGFFTGFLCEYFAMSF
jgi:hypothetical protein